MKIRLHYYRKKEKEKRKGQQIWKENNKGDQKIKWINREEENKTGNRKKSRKEQKDEQEEQKRTQKRTEGTDDG